ncbi:classical arabinogalactan protein 9-like isoform X2 [Triticum dicoccoides]|uniref:classical arabinogalactan protein 9-like isoform X2 n=1 Tax=Triticum dicoccoides TaxID=85692 RepID=UPI001890354B|nr:classical arabinogalactan protein 9-like isoform X2 [Triticum dicoccoides]XP_037471759.1 classical arabinogalactan protein 9-like isoform X2 [Triticum dicoccoides]
MQHQDLSPPTVPGPHPRQRIGAARRRRMRKIGAVPVTSWSRAAMAARPSWSAQRRPPRGRTPPSSAPSLTTRATSACSWWAASSSPTASTSPRLSPTATGPPQATSLASSPKPGGSMWPPPCSRPPASRMTSRPMSAAPASPSLPSSRKAPPCTQPAMRVYAPSTRSKKCRTTTVTMMALYTGIKKVIPVLLYSSSAQRRGHCCAAGWWKLVLDCGGTAEPLLQLPLLLPRATAAIDSMRSLDM